MRKINVNNEIKTLKTVMVHRPGEELLNLTPNLLDELLFDDIPDLDKAREEDDAFADIFRDNGIEVVYLEDLMAESLKPSKLGVHLVDVFQLNTWILQLILRT